MRRFVSILLMFLLVGQSLAIAPHWHGDESEADATEHAARPHVHLHGESGHHHDPAPRPTESAPEPVEHDSDAVFLTADEAVMDTTGTVVPPLTWSWLHVCPISASGFDLIRPADARVRVDWGDLLRPSCARYEQLLSIRC